MQVSLSLKITFSPVLFISNMTQSSGLTPNFSAASFAISDTEEPGGKVIWGEGEGGGGGMNWVIATTLGRKGEETTINFEREFQPSYLVILNSILVLSEALVTLQITCSQLL